MFKALVKISNAIEKKKVDDGIKLQPSSALVSLSNINQRNVNSKINLKQFSRIFKTANAGYLADNKRK